MSHLGIDLDVTARLLHETIDHRQSEAGSSLRALGREEGLEDLFDIVRGDAAPRVSHGDFHIIARRNVFHVGCRFGVQRTVEGFDRQFSALGLHCIARVDAEIEDRRFQHRCISANWPEAILRQD